VETDLGVPNVLIAAGFFTRDGLAYGWRWLHILFGIAWIGLLYYFNFVQVPSFAAYGEEGRARNVSINILARRALWYFRWAALATVLTGLLIAGFTKDYFSADSEGNGFFERTNGMAIATGMLLGLLMFLNVWGVIWRGQKVVLANAANVLGGAEPDPRAAAAGRAAGMASRQNTIFSVSMVWFMTYATHGPLTANDPSGAKVAAYWVIALIVIAVLEANCLGLLPWKREANKGLNVLYDGPPTSPRNPIIAAFGLWVIFLILTEVFFRV
jgi:uncharacterized membrane protein